MFIMIPAVEIQQIYIINGSWSLPTAFPSASLEYNFQNYKWYFYFRSQGFSPHPFKNMCGYFYVA